MSSTSGQSYGHQFRLFLGRSVRKKCADSQKNRNSSNDSNCLSKQLAKSHRKSSPTIKPKNKNPMKNIQTIVTQNSNHFDNNCLKTSFRIESNEELLGLHQLSQRLSPRPHRKSYSLNDLSLLLEAIEQLSAKQWDDCTDSGLRFSKFKRTLSYFSGKSLIRRKTKLKSKKMGQNSSSNNLDTSPVSTGSGSCGLNVKQDKKNDSCYQGKSQLPLMPLVFITLSRLYFT